MKLEGSSAIVTGSGSGIGRAIAVEFAANGMNVTVCGRREDRLRETVSQIEQAGGKAIAVPTDVTDPQSVKAMVDRTLEAFGQVDVLFNNAGSFDVIAGVWEADVDAWWHDVTVNLRGPMLCAHAVLPHMMQRDSGVIINMNGGGSGVPLCGGSAYGSSKAALLRLTDTLARELEREGSHVMSVAMGPGFVRTEMTEPQAFTDAGQKWLPGAKDAFEEGKTTPPEQCARDTVKLLSVLRPEFNGRVFGVRDDFDAAAAEAETLREKDLRTLRMRMK